MDPALAVVLAAAAVGIVTVGGRHLRGWWDRRRWARRLGAGAVPAHRIVVPAGPDGRPGESVLAPSRSPYLGRTWDGQAARQDFAVLLGRRSLLQVVCLGTTAECGTPATSAMDVVSSYQDRLGRVLSAPTPTELAGQPAVRYELRLTSGQTLVEWKLAYAGWLYAVGVLRHPADGTQVDALAAQTLRTWQWIDPPAPAGP